MSGWNPEVTEFEESSVNTIAHSKVMFAIVLVFWIFSTFFVYMFVNDHIRSRQADSAMSIDQNEDKDRAENLVGYGAFPSASPETAEYTPLIAFTGKWSKKQRALVLLWIIEYINWLMDTVFCFYFVIVIGEERTFPGSTYRVGSFCLAAQSCVALVVSKMLPRINNEFGTKAIWYIGNVLFAILCLFIGPMKNDTISIIVLSLLTGFSEATRDNNVYILLDKLTPAGQEGYYVALISNAMAVAQVTIGIFFGPITKYFFDDDASFSFSASAVFCLLWYVITMGLDYLKGYIIEGK